MRVLLWTDSKEFAGTERHCLELALGLAERGVCVSVGAPRYSPLALKAGEAGLDTVALDAKSRSRTAIGKVAELLRGGWVELVHAHNGVSTLLACLALERARRGSVVATQHFIDPARQRRRGVARFFSSALHRWIKPRVSRWIAISGAVAQAMRERGDTIEERLRVVLNGVAPPGRGEPSVREARRLAGVPEELPLLLCPARLEPEKGHATLLRALQILLQEGRRFQAVLIGGGTLEQSLRRRIQELKLEANVWVAGFQSHPEVWMKASDVVVLPSPDEPFGLVLVEAMSRGVPAVAAASGGPLEILDSESGLFFAPGDAEDLAAQLRLLLSEPHLRARMGVSAAMRYRALFSLERMAGEVNRVYEEALETVTRRGSWARSIQ